MRVALTIALALCTGLTLRAGSIAGSPGAWLLMRPSMDGIDARTDVPVREWHQVAAFETATECVHERKTQVELLVERAEEATVRAEAVIWTLAATAAEASRCVPAEYVYGADADEDGGADSENSAAQPI